MTATKEHYETVKAEAIEMARKYGNVWMYQIGNTFGFRFAEMPKGERGILVARFDENGTTY